MTRAWIDSRLAYEREERLDVVYDRQTATLVITLREAPIEKSDEVRPGVIADFGPDGGVVRFEAPRASRVIKDASRVQFATTGSPCPI